MSVPEWTREEMQRAHDNYVATAMEAGRTGDWKPWAALFTEDARYIEHHYGVFEGRAAIEAWISETMAEWPNSAMTEFPHDWCVCDLERGRWICQIENRFRDPGGGEVYEAANVTILQYAGDMQFASEEDVYNPANFAPVVKQWITASRAHGGTGQD
jgi:SnoaL-like domain